MGSLHLYCVYFHAKECCEIFQVSTCRSNSLFNFIEFQFFVCLYSLLFTNYLDIDFYQWNLWCNQDACTYVLGHLYINLLRFLQVGSLSQKIFSFKFNFNFDTFCQIFLHKFSFQFILPSIVLILLNFNLFLSYFIC